MAKDKEGTQDRQERITELDKQIATLDETLELFRKQLQQSQGDLGELDEKQAEQLEEILNKLPQGATPKGVLDEILKAATPKRTQILNNISKLETSIKIETVKKSKLGIEKRKIEETIKEDGLNELTERLCQTFKATLDKYMEWENSFINLKEKISEIGLLDPMYFNRIDNSKHSSFYNQVFGLILMKPGSLPGLTPNYFITTIQEIGKESENPLKAGRFIREDGKHIFEQGSPGHKAFEKPTADEVAEERIGEIFEPGPGPTIPTVGE